MPLFVILWIVCLAPCLAAALLTFALIRNKGDKFSNDMLHIVVLLILVTSLAAPNLLWYKAVRNVMMPDQQIELKAEAN